MGFLDKAKAAAEQAAAKAKGGVEDVQVKRELGQAYGELGRSAFDLIESGEISHPQLDEVHLVPRVGGRSDAERGPCPVVHGPAALPAAQLVAGDLLPGQEHGKESTTAAAGCRTGRRPLQPAAGNLRPAAYRHLGTCRGLRGATL